MTNIIFSTPTPFSKFLDLTLKIYILIFPGICLSQYTKEDWAVVCTKVWLIARCQSRKIAADQSMRVHIISIHVLTWGLRKPWSLRKNTLFSVLMQWIKSKLGYYASLAITRFGIHKYWMMHQSIMIMISLWATKSSLVARCLYWRRVLISSKYLGTLKISILIHRQKHWIATNYLKRMYKLMKISGLTLMAVLQITLKVGEILISI